MNTVKLTEKEQISLQEKIEYAFDNGTGDAFYINESGDIVAISRHINPDVMCDKGWAYLVLYTCKRKNPHQEKTKQETGAPVDVPADIQDFLSSKPSDYPSTWEYIAARKKVQDFYKKAAPETPVPVRYTNYNGKRLRITIQKNELWYTPGLYTRPHSKPGFCFDKLEKALQSRGIHYVSAGYAFI